MSTGGGGPVSQVAAMTPQQQNLASGATYTPIRQGPVYQPQYQAYQPQARAAQTQQQIPNYQSGLQAAMMHMMQQYSRPAMRAPLQQGIFPSSPLTYRPDMSNIQSNLNRVASPVTYEQMHPVVVPSGGGGEGSPFDGGGGGDSGGDGDGDGGDGGSGGGDGGGGAGGDRAGGLLTVKRNK